MSKQVNYNENLCAGAAIRDDKGRRISKLFEASHPKMTVGYAKNLIMPDTPTEQEFNFRQAGGGVIEDGVAVIDKVKGKSVVWNQLIKDFREPSNWLMGGNDVTVVGDKIHIKFASTSSSNAFGVKSSAFLAGHRYCILMNNENAMPLTAIKLGSASSIGNIGSTLNNKTPLITGAIITSSESAGALWIWPSDETKLEGDFSNIYAIDLTQMFGAGNEPSTVEEFLSRKPKVADEYAYNEGEIVNNKVEKVKATGFNQWDEEWESGSYDIKTGEKVVNSNYTRSKNFTHVIPSSSIYLRTTITIGAIYILFYDREQKYLSYITGSNRIINIPGNCCYINIVWLNSEYGSTTYNNDICINLSDPAINGQYFPYEKHELDLSWVKDIKDAEGVKLFEDGMKSAGTAYDEVGKNKAVKRLGVKVFDGTENWMFANNIVERLTNVCFLTMGDDFGALSNGDVVNMICSNYEQLVGYSPEGSLLSYFNTVSYNISKQLTIKDSAYTTSVETWKSHLADLYAQGNPLKVVYELAEPIEVEYDEKNLTYPAVAGGTEEAIASEPSSAFRADIGYGIDAVKTILDLKARVEALEAK